MIDMHIFKQSLSYSAGAVLYIATIATVMQNTEKIFGAEDIAILAPMGFLLLLVVSAATMGILIFGKPIMLYVDGKKREGVATAICTIIQMALFTAAIFVAMAFLNR